MIIRRVEPLSCGKIAGLIYGVLGLVMGAFITMLSLLGAAISGTQSVSETARSPVFGAVVGVFAIIMFPILYGVLGFLCAVIGAWLYNLVASRIGGIEIDVA